MTARTLKSISFLIAVCLLAWERPACAQQVTRVTEAAAPKAVMPVVSYNFGDVRRGESISHVFIIKNEGTADLVIKEFKPG